MTEKMIGYLLLLVGLIVIIYSGFNVYMVFTSRARPINLFNFDSIETNVVDLIGGDLSAEERALAQSQAGDAKIEILPAEILNQSSNVIAHIFLMGFIVSVGYKIASLGIQMLRPVIVKLNEQKEQKTN